MYIHSYQIHNVLNDYRKQLSHGPRANGEKHTPAAHTKDRISISTDGQRQSIMDKISSDIVARITQSGPENKFEAVLADRLSVTSRPQNEAACNEPSEFKYTVIDENNCRRTNTLTIQGLSPASNGTESAVGRYNGKNMNPETG